MLHSMLHPSLAPLSNADNISFDFDSGGGYSTLTSSPCTPPHTLSYKPLHSGLPADANTWLNPFTPINVATSSPNALPTAGPGEHSTAFSDPWRSKARAEDGDAPWLESSSLDVRENGVDAVSAAFLQLIEAHGCGPSPEVVPLLRLLLCNSCLPREELLDVVDWRRLLRLAATSSSRVLRCTAWLVPSTTSSLISTGSTTVRNSCPPADTTPRTAISDYELHGMQSLSPSRFLNGPASPALPSGALNSVLTASTIPTTPLTISPAFFMPPPRPESPPKIPLNSSEPTIEPELDHSPKHQQPVSQPDAATASKRRCLDCKVEHTKQWRTHPELPGYLCNVRGQHQAKHKSPRSQLAIRREWARANE
ncbi:hypothetical protein B0H13DRAFT_1878986 [Mycena leptocephala]|nr:hypothetical protein B0H13DRAFT_1878986 [Mycena leptocephala]